MIQKTLQSVSVNPWIQFDGKGLMHVDFMRMQHLNLCLHTTVDKKLKCLKFSVLYQEEFI